MAKFIKPLQLSLPDIKPGEQLQQQRAGVSQRVTQEGSWQRETDQAIQETSASRIVTSDSETRTTSTRTTTINGNDSTTTIGTTTLLSGAILHVADGDFSQATNANFVTKVAKNRTDDIGQNLNLNIGENLNMSINQDYHSTIQGQLNENIAGIRKSLASAHEMMGSSFHIGTGDINLLTLMTDMLDTIDKLVKLTAEHTHSNTGAPTNSGAINGISSEVNQLTEKYKPIIK